MQKLYYKDYKRKERNRLIKQMTVYFVVTAIVTVIVIAATNSILVQTGKATMAGLEYVEAKRATTECEKWADEAMVYQEYFLVPWQKMQCDTYGIAINAPVVDNTK